MEQFNEKSRKALRNKMAEVFSENIKTLPDEMRYILLDDLVTAFENRLSIFCQSKHGHAATEFEFELEDDERILA